MRWVSDSTGRFRQRPYFSTDELNAECHRVLSEFLVRRYGVLRFPISTDDLTVLIEEHADDLELYSDLTAEGAGVDGVTIFVPGASPRVRIARRLSEGAKAENRLRSTLAHELTHVLLHRRIYDDPANMLKTVPVSDSAQRCQQKSIISAADHDWMEWQAGFGCGAILMPRQLLFQRAVRFGGACGTEGPYGADTAAGQDLSRDIASGFAVSVAAARTRLIAEGILIKTVPPLVALQMLRPRREGLEHCAAVLARIALPLGLTFLPASPTSGAQSDS